MSLSTAETRQLVLASTSPYRRELLGRLGLPFECARPETDETPLAGEGFAQTALRLAAAKARAVQGAWPDALIIGSDQVAYCDGRRLDKPGNHENAVAQLTFLAGRVASFDTAVCVFDSRSGRAETRVVPCKVHFRQSDPARIEAYLRREQPYDCAGSAKAEGLGIALIARIETDDPTSLIGLPLIALTDLLGAFGLSPV
ncbi:MAG: septum formation protein Maf [Proteobacteria bacterium]|nr:septum formation protein Maf [Pseudomonadota bacterium]